MLILWLVGIGFICIVSGLIWSARNIDSNTAIGLMAIGIILIFTGSAFGHDHKNPAQTDWLKTLHNKKKELCCDGNDTDAIEDWETKGGNYRVKFRGQWFDVPEDTVVEGPNKMGLPLLWMNKGYLGMSVRCFMPGSMT